MLRERDEFGRPLTLVSQLPHACMELVLHFFVSGAKSRKGRRPEPLRVALSGLPPGLAECGAVHLSRRQLHACPGAGAGESSPRGDSSAPALHSVELAPGEVDRAALSSLRRNPERATRSGSGAFLSWTSRRLRRVQHQLQTRAALRNQGQRAAKTHARLPQHWRNYRAPGSLAANSPEVGAINASHSWPGAKGCEGAGGTGGPQAQY